MISVIIRAKHRQHRLGMVDASRRDDGQDE
jgi:hypothetical protein